MAVAALNLPPTSMRDLAFTTTISSSRRMGAILGDG